MIAREWKSRCPRQHKAGFIDYLYQTGVKDASSTTGFSGAQILTRELDDRIEVTLVTYWASIESIKAFAGEEIAVARLYPEDEKFELDPDRFVTHYGVVEMFGPDLSFPT